MVSGQVNNIPWPSDDDVITAAFLFQEICQKPEICNMSKLRNFLVRKRGFNCRQVIEAFKFHRTWINGSLLKSDNVSDSSECANDPGESKVPPSESTAITEYSASPPETKSSSWAISNSGYKTNKPCKKRPEHLFLIPPRQIEGQQLLDDFLASEKKYCAVLRCLYNEYYKELFFKAEQRAFLIDRKKIEAIFYHVPKLLKFHRHFYKSLKGGSCISHTFIKHFDMFKRYIVYMTNCSKTISKIRGYINDENLWKCLASIRQRSKQEDDMFDLLLIPLDRISEYWKFLESLHEWTDRRHSVEFSTRDRTRRRIARIAKHIERYKHSIKNSCEVHKVQLFIGDSYKIVSHDRKIVRRGVLRCKSSDGIVGEKEFIFFLFNDVLIWTTEEGQLQNQVELRYCEIFPPDDGDDQERQLLLKFGPKSEENIILMSESKMEMDAWRHALKTEINSRRSVWSATPPLSPAASKGMKPFRPLPNIEISYSEETKARNLSADDFTNIRVGGLRSKDAESPNRSDILEHSSNIDRDDPSVAFLTPLDREGVSDSKRSDERQKIVRWSKGSRGRGGVKKGPLEDRKSGDRTSMSLSSTFSDPLSAKIVRSPKSFGSKSSFETTAASVVRLNSFSTIHLYEFDEM